MASVHTLTLKNIRSHSDFTVTFSPEVTIITGANGSGKTSILEAIYVALQGSSFKGSDADMLRRESPWWNIAVTLNDKQQRIITFDPIKQTRRKQFTIDNKTNARIPAKLKHPIVLFDPEDLRLLHGSPSRRRKFIDTFITQLNPTYGTTLRKYERALKQRNNILKSNYIQNDQLFAWNVALAEYGAYIVEQRIRFIEQLNSNLAEKYKEIAGTNDDVSMHYSHTYIGDIKQKILNDLHTHYEKDRATGSTTTGPHRHDVLFFINTSPALSTASRGEARTVVLALKFLEVFIIERITEKQPIILLDDVFSELDASRQKLLTKQLSGYQIIITSATSSVGEDSPHIVL